MTGIAVIECTPPALIVQAPKAKCRIATPPSGSDPQDWINLVVPTDVEWQALDARVVALETGAPPPDPDPDFDFSTVDLDTAGDHFALGFILYATAWVIGKGVGVILSLIAR